MKKLFDLEENIFIIVPLMCAFFNFAMGDVEIATFYMTCGIFVVVNDIRCLIKRINK